ncbi:hypothetical protein ACWECC_15055 [Streptomyces microflavus]
MGRGECGHIALKITHHLGVEVVQFTRTADKADSARALGVDDVVVSTDERAMARQKGRFDLLLDTGGARRAVYDRPRHGRHALPDRHGGGATALKARAGPGLPAPAAGHGDGGVRYLPRYAVRLYDSHLVHPELVHDRRRTALARAVRRAFAPRDGTSCAP